MSNFKAWAKDVALRAVKTAAQAAGAVITANTAGLTHLDFAVVADVAAMAAFVCVLQNLSNLKVPDPTVAAEVADVVKAVDVSTFRQPNMAVNGTAAVVTTAPVVDPTVPAASS